MNTERAPAKCLIQLGEPDCDKYITQFSGLVVRKFDVTQATLKTLVDSRLGNGWSLPPKHHQVATELFLLTSIPLHSYLQSHRTSPHLKYGVSQPCIAVARTVFQTTRILTMSNILADRDVNSQTNTTQPETDGPKSMEYHRQQFEARMKDDRYLPPSFPLSEYLYPTKADVTMRFLQNSGKTYISPSDNIMSPATQKLAAFKNKHMAKGYVNHFDSGGKLMKSLKHETPITLRTHSVEEPREALRSLRRHPKEEHRD